MLTDRAGTVIIPAYNEAASISTSLAMLLAGSLPGELAVVVVCNGCTDETADMARSTARELGHEVVVVERATAGKAAALRAVEDLDLPYPRLYLDADVDCPTSTARALFGAIAQGADLAVPARRLDVSASSLLARLYYRGWESMPWVARQLAGRGAYAVSDGMREVFARFPDVVADDRLVTMSVRGDQAVIVAEPTTIRPPGRIRDVVRVRSRVYAGNAVVAAPTHDQPAAKRLSGMLAVARRPSAWPALLVFAAVSAAAKARSGWTVRKGSMRWDRDSRPKVTA